MTNKQILETAIQKAIDGGWGGFNMNAPWSVDFTGHFLHHEIAGEEFMSHIYRYIFDHSFAKALWPGEDSVYASEIYRSPVDGDAGFDEYLTLSEYHLQQMVIAEDPIKYLGENI